MKCPACGAKISLPGSDTTRAGAAPKCGTEAPEEPDERYRELEEFCESDPMMREVEEEAAREIEKESKRLKAPKGDEPSDIYIEPTHKEKLARAARAGKVGPVTPGEADGKASTAEKPRAKRKKERGMKLPRKPPADDSAAEALSGYAWQLEKATRYATDEKDDELLGMLRDVDKGMREEDYVSLVMLAGQIECRYEDEPPEDLRGILECIQGYVAGLES
jgi:hypothetical protein